MAKKPELVLDSRPVKTLYYRDDRLLRVNAGLWCNNAVKNCVGHMQVNKYGATSAEIIDGRKADTLHAVITHNVVGEVNIIFHREVKEGM